MKMFQPFNESAATFCWYCRQEPILEKRGLVRVAFLLNIDLGFLWKSRKEIYFDSNFNEFAGGSMFPENWLLEMYMYPCSWGRFLIELILNYFELACNKDLKRIFFKYFWKLSLIMKLQNATKLLSVSCSWMLSDQ